ncbi:HNH endonuclease [Streptomyces cadmiisoli]|uniref:HNH endonuclease n=1 Tax=Streptomyces cadmiisoli TaxID=2184053 RepID=UPI0036504F9F
MAWQGSTRKARLPRNWPQIRRRILRRDKGLCQTRFSEGQLCGRDATDVDHIVPGDDHSDANLQALCDWCHAARAAVRAAQQRASRACVHSDPRGHTQHWRSSP